MFYQRMVGCLKFFVNKNDKLGENMFFKFFYAFQEFKAKKRFEENAMVGKNFSCGRHTGIYNKRNEKKAISLGNNVTLLDAQLRCYEKGQIEIGDHSWFSLRTQIISCSSVKIGSYCIFARDVYISDTNEHPINPMARREQTLIGGEPDRYKSATVPIFIGDDVWVGERACIMKGVTIGNGVIVAANAVVTKDVPDYCIVAGNPAKVVKYGIDKI